MKLTLSQIKDPPIQLEDVTEEVRSSNLPTIIEHQELDSLASHAVDAIEDLHVPIALRNVDLSLITDKASLLCALTHNLPRNEYNMPKILYRPDLLDPQIFYVPRVTTPKHTEDPVTPRLTRLSRPETAVAEDKFQLMQELLDASTITLDYYEGYPAYQSQPIWAKFPWETDDDYDIFNSYLELPGARQIGALVDKREKAGELFHVNYWGLRCLASDTFAVVHYKRQRERRILQTDDVHFLQAEKILRQLISQIPDVNWDTLNEEPKVFVEVLERVAKIQRAALGTTERRSEDERNIPSVELIMRKSAEHLAPLSKEEDVGGVNIAKLLRDPKSVQDAQELILRIGGQK